MGYLLTYHDDGQLPHYAGTSDVEPQGVTLTSDTTNCFDTLSATHLYLPPGRRELQEQRQHPTAGR
jgi:hypothetical protein